MVRGLIYLFFRRSRGMPARDKSLGYAAPPVVTVQSQSTGQGGGGQTLSERSRPQKRKRLLLVPPCALEASGKTRWMAPPAPTSKATRNLMVSPTGNNIGPFVSPLTPSLFPRAKGFPAAHILAVPPPWALGQPLDFVPCQEAGAVKTGFSSCPAHQGLGIWAKKPAGPKVQGKVHECSHA